MIFEWNKKKSEINVKKHGISFEEAVSVFVDEDAVLFDDPDHSTEEDRFLIIGVSNKMNICIVSHCYRHEEIIRIISARKATKKEKAVYINRKGVHDEK